MKTNKLSARILSMALTVALLLGLSQTGLFAPQEVYADTAGAFDISGTAGGWSYSENTLTITENGTYAIGMETPGASATSDKISVQSDLSSVNITLDGVSIADISGNNAFDIRENTKVQLTLSGENTLQGGDNRAGLSLGSGTSVTIGGSGNLTATGGTGTWADNTRAGVYVPSTATFTINSGTLMATGGIAIGGGTAGAGIGGGGGSDASCGIVIINGGIVTATGYSSKGSSGIGGGYAGNGGTVVINGGYITATGYRAIGKGYTGTSEGTLTLPAAYAYTYRFNTSAQVPGAEYKSSVFEPYSWSDTHKYLEFATTFIRISDTEATISFLAGMAGTAYYLVKNSEEAPPTGEEIADAGVSLGSVPEGFVGGIPVALTAGAKDIFIVVEDAAGNFSSVWKIEVAAYVAPHTHTWKTTWASDATDHWHECTAGDGATNSVAAHTPGDWIMDTLATATTNGSKHKACTVCGYITVTENIPATGDSSGGGNGDNGDDNGGGAGGDTNGDDTLIVTKDADGTPMLTEYPSAAKPLDLQYFTDGKSVTVADVTWTGKQIKSGVTIKVTYKVGGKTTTRTLVSGKDYTITKSGANKDIGQGTVTLKGQGVFTGTKALTFKIVPTKPAGLKVKTAKKSMTVSFKKINKAQKITTYKVQYRIKGSAAWKSKIVKVKLTGKAAKQKTAQITLKNLKSKKTYEVQVYACKGIYQGLPGSIKKVKMK